MIKQLNELFAVMVSDTGVGRESALVRTGITVLRHQPDIKADEMPLSTFNVLLSENHGRGSVPVVAFPTGSKDTDIKNAITSAMRISLSQKLDFVQMWHKDLGILLMRLLTTSQSMPTLWKVI